MPTETPNLPALTDYQLDPVAEGFFGRWGEEGEEPVRAPELSRGDRRAMRATFAIFGVFGIALIAFVIYARVIMPVPAELEGEHGLPAAPAATAAGL
jgi:hypothetical protein